VDSARCEAQHFSKSFFFRSTSPDDGGGGGTKRAGNNKNPREELLDRKESTCGQRGFPVVTEAKSSITKPSIHRGGLFLWT